MRTGISRTRQTCFRALSGAPFMNRYFRGIGAPGMVGKRRHVAPPPSLADPRPLLVRPQHRGRTGCVRNASRGRLGNISVTAGSRDETWPRLVVVLPTVPNDQSAGIAELMDHANAVLHEMVDEGAITAGERAGMVLGAHPRRKAELLAPFAEEGRFQKLILEDYGESVLPDPAWTEYQNGGDKGALARKRTLFFRATFMPSLASGLSRVRDGDREALRLFATGWRMA